MGHHNAMKNAAILLLTAAFLSSCGNSENPSNSSVVSSQETSSKKEESIVSSSSVETSSVITSSESSAEQSSEEAPSIAVSGEELSTAISVEESSEGEISSAAPIEESSEAEASSIDPAIYQIDASVWESIINEGAMTDLLANFACTMNKSMKDIENRSTSTFFVAGGDLQRSYPASFDETLIITEYFELLDWGNPTSKYYHYTYQRAEEKWEREELNSKYLHFYRDDLGIIIDLTFAELTFDEEKLCYTCSHKKSYPYDSTFSYEIYDDIEIYFENDKLQEIKYDAKGALWSFTYHDYGLTVVDVPNPSIS